MDTQTVGEVAEPTAEEQALREQYPAVTQFKGRTIRYAPLSEGQTVALQALERDDDGHLVSGSVSVILAVLEGCVGPDQWQRIRLDLARKKIDAADVMRLFVKIMDKAKRDGEKTAAA
ncbi:hypothetical protein [Streptomyces drozdowiczii]|uniref:Uncharacterized protein n=1 Tax=Streptomyces drozdowiczii TaxID=202862 RepID=A0ABY6PPG4_9ACTN|nr:hypothetical protein [Streptomyces drozdowiczii]MCX0246408.1 hypothetical protein [Streptomyces drozdowiczii]UZK54088.1 hypothetical protein NEH16_07910 [Streptomyces drozdowiczii]